MLLRNEGGATAATGGGLRFTEVAMAAGADDIFDARGVAVADLDRDGDLDIVLNHNPGDEARHTARAVVYRNDVADGRPSLSLELEGRSGNRDAVGAVVSVRIGDRWQTRLRSAGSGYASQHSSRLHFGLAGGERVDEVEVRWPGGDVERVRTLAAGSYRWVEGEGPAAVVVGTTSRLGEAGAEGAAEPPGGAAASPAEA